MFGVDLPDGPHPDAAGGAASITPARSPADRPRRSACARTTSPVDAGLTSHTPGADVVETGVTGSPRPGSKARTASSTNPAEPALPKDVVDVTPIDDDLVLRGVGFRGGT